MKKVTKVFSVMVASVALAAMLSGCGGDKKPAGGGRRPSAVGIESAAKIWHNKRKTPYRE